LSGGINIAIPKDIGKQQSWQFNGRSCQLIMTFPEEQLMTIACKFKGYSATEFVYSPSRGVISYIRSSNPTDEYKLIAGNGLFAAQGMRSE